MSNENPTPESNNKPGRLAAPTLIQAAFPEKPTVVFFAALVIGILFIVMIAFFRPYFAVNTVQSNLVLCLGVALVLAAFGGQATVRIGGIIMVGVAAVTLGLFFHLQHESLRQHELFLQGTIKGFDMDTYTSLEMKDKVPIRGRVLKGDDRKQSTYEFVIFKQEFSNFPFIDVALFGQKKEPVPLRVKRSHFDWAFGSSDGLVWEFREEGPERILTLYDLINDKTIAKEVLRGTLGITRTPSGPTLINAAFAQERSAIDVPLMLKRLEADDTATRRDARDALSQAPVEFIPTIMETLRKKDVSYREKLGICVALAEMLRADKHKAAAIRSKLNDDDLKRMVDAAGDPDRTVRVYAAEFLYDLEDKRTPKLAIPLAAETSDDNARYNWLLVSQSGWGELSTKEKAELETPLKKAKQRSGPKTLQLFEKLQK